eukprot:scaffold38887_cov15-Tisochrysis_lutea.AAC.1
MPNVMVNLQRLPKASSRPSCRFFAGDWSSVGELLTNQVSAERSWRPYKQKQRRNGVHAHGEGFGCVSYAQTAS